MPDAVAVPDPPDVLARLLQPEDIGALILFVAQQPAHVCVNEVLVSPTYNRAYVGLLQAQTAAREGKR